MVPMSVSLKLLQMNLIVNLIVKRQKLQTLTAASSRDSMWRGSKNGKILNFQRLIFCIFSRNLSRISKENHLSKKK